MTYAKLTPTGNLQPLGFVPGITNASEATMQRYANEEGYLPVEYTDPPGEWYTSSFVQRAGRIEQVWTPWDNAAKMSVVQSMVQSLLDSKAQERQYDNIFTALTYINSTNKKFAAEAAALRDWRDAIWTECYAYLAKVEAGEVRMPDSWEEVEKLLPSFRWPDEQ